MLENILEEEAGVRELVVNKPTRGELEKIELLLFEGKREVPGTVDEGINEFEKLLFELCEPKIVREPEGNEKGVED